MKALTAFVFALLSLSATAEAQYYSSATSCAGYTSCFDYYGNNVGTVSCQVYGAQYLQGFGYSASNNCSWYVQPGIGVECSGYTQTTNPYTGQAMWSWQTFSARCPGR